MVKSGPKMRWNISLEIVLLLLVTNLVTSIATMMSLEDKIKDLQAKVDALDEMDYKYSDDFSYSIARNRVKRQIPLNFVGSAIETTIRVAPKIPKLRDQLAGGVDKASKGMLYMMDGFGLLMEELNRIFKKIQEVTNTNPVDVITGGNNPVTGFIPGIGRRKK